MKNVLASFTLLLLAFFLLPVQKAQAACDFYHSMDAATKNVSWNTTCTVTTIDGIDDAGNTETSINNVATLSLTGGSITINAGGVLRVGSLALTIGTVAIQGGGMIQTTAPLWVADADSDGTADAWTLYDATVAGRRRLSLMRSFAACTLTTWYADGDNDTYGDPNVTQSACNQPAGYVANNTDCYDGNANAYPSSTYCSSTNRGDGSFDYNCSETATKCDTIYGYATSTSTYTRNVGLGSCNQGNCRCVSQSSSYYATATINCGQTGAVCTGTTGFEYGCLDASPCGDPCKPAGISTRCTSKTNGVQKCQ